MLMILRAHTNTHIFIMIDRIRMYAGYGNSFNRLNNGVWFCYNGDMSGALCPSVLFQVGLYPGGYFLVGLCPGSTGVDRWGTGGGDASPHFSGWRDSIGIVPPPHFSDQKHCEAYSLTQHSSLLKAAT